MSGKKSVIVPPGQGHAFTLPPGASAAITLTDGPQVVDAWAFCTADLNEYLSCEHTRSCLEKLRPGIGDAFYSNRRRPLLTLVADSSPGIHDLLLSACDAERYALLGHQGPHRSCADNLREALGALGHQIDHVPSPVNIFENVGIDKTGRLEILPPVATRGDHITLRAELDLILVLSTCPMDIVPTNGADRRVKAVEVTVAPPA